MEPTENVELEVTENQYWVDKAEALARLRKNRDFQSLILDGYFKDKAINGVSMLAKDYIKDNGKRGDVMESLVAISHLEDYFSYVNALGSVAKADMEEANSPVVG